MVDEKAAIQYLLSKSDVLVEDLEQRFGKAKYPAIIEKYLPKLKELGINIITIKDDLDKPHFIVVLPGISPDLTDQELEVFLFLTYMIRKKQGKMTYAEVRARLSDSASTVKDLIELHGLFKVTNETIIMTPRNIAVLEPIFGDFVSKMDNFLK